MAKAASEGSPAKSVLEELERVRAILHEMVARYQIRLEGEIDALKSVVGEEGKLSKDKMRDLRDMLTVLRNFEVKVEKGRRKNLRKVETLLEDMALLTENWGPVPAEKTAPST